MSSNLIITAAGNSTRYPDVKPKWMLTHPNGNLMVTESIRGLDFGGKIYLVVLKDHIKNFANLEGIKKAFQYIGIKDNLEIVQIENTRNQPESVYKVIKKCNIKGSIYVKDSDNYFETKVCSDNAVAVYDLNKMSLVNPSNKSYIQKDDNDFVNTIVEKNVISNLFCCGGHSFESVELFNEYFLKMKEEDNLYLSHMIFKMILEDVNFRSYLVENYVDWGTLQDWNRYKRKFKTLFVDIDGVLVENAGEFFGKIWGEKEGIKNNIKVLNDLYDTGNVKIILTTSRRKEYMNVTLNQLKKYDIKYHDIIFDLYHGQRIVINDYSKTNPFESCKAINIKRNDDNLGDLI